MKAEEVIRWSSMEVGGTLAIVKCNEMLRTSQYSICFLREDALGNEYLDRVRIDGHTVKAMAQVLGEAICTLKKLRVMVDNGAIKGCPQEEEEFMRMIDAALSDYDR